ncbi:hypothetical protein KEM56_003892 [Ascosphaera pollenicola]|nr:hypothetical protein KEM56_003892 [Ascosphaera pollenicola]
MPTPEIPLLLPYTAPQPAGSLTVCTSVLGAANSWLVLRLIYDTLYAADSGIPAELREGRGSAHGRGPRNLSKKVVLVSFLRSWEFWKTEGRRLGLDFNKLSNEGAFAFVDGLSELFTPGATSTPASTGPLPMGAARPGRPGLQTLPIRGSPETAARAPPAAPFPQPAAGPRTNESKTLKWTGRPDQALDGIQREIEAVIDNMKAKEQDGNEVLLVIDQPDLLLAAGSGDSLGAAEMSDFIMGLREAVHSTVVVLSADSPLIYNTTPGSTPLEVEGASFVASMAYQARTVLQLRCLDTGVAKDVSGVLRVSKGGKSAVTQKPSTTQSAGGDEREFLYHLKGDGSVSLFGRGEVH